VSVKNDKTGEQRSATTNAQGFFVVGGLKPSTYTIRVAGGEFRPSRVSQHAAAGSCGVVGSIPPEGPPASLRTVNVTADVPVVDSSSARLGRQRQRNLK